MSEAGSGEERGEAGQGAHPRGGGVAEAGRQEG